MATELTCALFYSRTETFTLFLVLMRIIILYFFDMVQANGVHNFNSSFGCFSYQLIC